MVELSWVSFIEVLGADLNDSVFDLAHLHCEFHGDYVGLIVFY